MIAVGVIGAGGHSSRNHGPALQRVADRRDDVALAAICDLQADRAEQYAADFGFACTYTDVETMLDREPIDALVAVTPQAKTAAIVAELLPRGIPLLLEKPPGRTSTETADLLAIAEETGTDHMISFNRRFNPAARRAKAWLEETGRTPDHVSSTMRRVGRLEDGFRVETGIHLVDFQHALCGTPSTVTGSSWHTRGNEGEAASARTAYENGTTGTTTMIADAGLAAERHELTGPGWSLDLDLRNASYTAHVDGEVAAAWDRDDAPGYERNGALAETEAFLDAVRGERSFAPDLRAGVVSMRLAEATAAGDTTDVVLP